MAINHNVTGFITEDFGQVVPELNRLSWMTSCILLGADEEKDVISNALQRFLEGTSGNGTALADSQKSVLAIYVIHAANVLGLSVSGEIK